MSRLVEGEAFGRIAECAAGVENKGSNKIAKFKLEGRRGLS